MPVVICYKCAKQKGISTPPVRTRREPCESCGQDDDIPVGRNKGMNYDIPDVQMLGSKNDPNEISRREEAQATG